jgi:hypothetical protein
MALSQLELSLMAFPQSWDPASSMLDVNVFLLPVGDPTAPLGTGPKFAGTAVHLTANIVAGLAALPTPTTTPSQVTPFFAQPPAVAVSLYAKLHDQLIAKGITVNGTGLTNKTEAPPQSVRILKSLPDSYTKAFNFGGPASRDVRVGDGYCCALRAQAPGLNAPQPPVDNSIAWGQVLSYAMRQPILAQYMGLFYAVKLNVPSNMLANGGFVYFTLDASAPGNPWVADWRAVPDSVKSYAARIPALGATARPLFGAVLLPVVAAGTAGDLTAAQFDAQEYDDGFAQIVHSNQPITIDAATLEADHLPPGTDAGIQVGWDDETVTAWLNNQVDLLRYRLDPTLFPAAPPPETPIGVMGYRVDVRQTGGTGLWSSLCEVSGVLPFNASKYGGGASTPMGDEFWVAPAPIRPSTGSAVNSEPSWLPLYFALWNGQSLVLQDPIVQYLATGANLAGTGKPLPAPSLLPPNPSPVLTNVPNLVYGNDYEFRVRLVDLTGCGPQVGDDPVHPGLAATTLVGFRRYIPPKAIEVAASPTFPGYPAAPPPTRTITNLAVSRPRIGYPEALYAGVDPSTFDLTNLQTLIQQAWAANRAVSVPDPDVGSFNVVIEARVPVNDTGDSGMKPDNLDGAFRVIYTVEVPFPTDQGNDPTVTLEIDYVDGIDDIATLKLSPPALGSTTIPVPTARDIRIRLIPLCSAKSSYYGPDGPPSGPSSDYIVRQEASVEDAIFPNTPESQLQAFYFQPGDNVPQLLAQELGLNQQDLTFTGASGERTVFGAAGSLRHTVSADGSSMTISNQTELVGQWIVALVLDLNRDWTWTGLAQPSKSGQNPPPPNPPQITFSRGAQPLGVVTIPRVVSPATSGSMNPPPDRSHTKIVFFDGIDPNAVPGTFPSVLTPTYNVTVNFAKATSQQFNLPIMLPITTPPVQTPKLVSTGIAESPYVMAQNYSETAPRQRYLWVEFDQPIADPDDTYFARVLAYGPDPLLAADLRPMPSAAEMLPNAVEPPLPIDPELVRAVYSGQSEDYAGLDAMTQMVPAKAAVGGKKGAFFMLPLPPGMTSESLELFGFWTYEFRVGHVQQWSTAQGRYGRPLRVVGLQHPSPHLTCTVNRSTQKAASIAALAPYANTVYNGRRVYDIVAGDPQTNIWFMLYGQVLQADGASWRNVLLTHQLGELIDRAPVGKTTLQQSTNRNPMAGSDFAMTTVNQLLALVGLPTSTPLSVIAVEVLPGEARINLIDDPLAGTTVAGAPQAKPASIAVEDPLGAQLGRRRILRTSPLVAVPSAC